jgi:hypothetical protein
MTIYCLSTLSPCVIITGPLIYLREGIVHAQRYEVDQSEAV